MVVVYSYAERFVVVVDVFVHWRLRWFVALEEQSLVASGVVGVAGAFLRETGFLPVTAIDWIQRRGCERKRRRRFLGKGNSA